MSILVTGPRGFVGARVMEEDELKERDGVDTIITEPYKKKVVNHEGPVIVLVVTD